jgi:hypothetical protein
LNGKEETMAPATLDRITRYAGWAAYASATLGFISGVFLFLFYALGPGSNAPGGSSPVDFGRLNDVVGLFGDIVGLPLPVALYWLTRRHGQALSIVAMALGVLGILTIFIAQTLLVADIINFEVNLPFAMLGLALLGSWLILANYLGRAGDVLGRWLSWLGGLTGLVFLVAVGLIVLSDPFDDLSAGALGQSSPVVIGAVIALAILGAGAYLLGFPIWLIGLGRRLLASPARSEESAASRARR